MTYKRSTIIFYLISLFHGMVFYGPIATLYRQAHGVTLFQMTIIESISLVLIILLEIPWGFVADRIGYRNTLLISNALFFISKIIFWKATGFAWFLAERILLSVVFSGFSGCDTAYLFLLAKKDENESTKIFGRNAAFGTVGLVVASLVYSGAIGDNFALAGFLTAVSYGVAMLLTFFLDDIREEGQENHRKIQDFFDIFGVIFKKKEFFLFLLAATLLAQVNQTVTVFLCQVQYVRVGLSQSAMGIVYIFVTLAALSSGYAHKLTKRFGEHHISVALFSIAALCCVLLSITESAVTTIVAIVLLRATASMFKPIETTIENQQVELGDRATILSIYCCFMDIGAVFTNLIFGKLADANIAYALFAGFVFCFCGLLAYAIWYKKYS